MELDGIASNTTTLGEAAKTAIAFVARARRLAQSRNVARQPPLVAERTHRAGRLR